MNKKPIADSRTFSCHIKYVGLQDNAQDKKAILAFQKVLEDQEGNLVAVEEEIRVLIGNDKVSASKAKPQDRTQRTQGQPAPVPVTNYAETGAYDAFDRSDAAIEDAYTDYVAPLYQ